MVDPTDLLALLALTRSRTHTAAAAVLGVSHTTISRRIHSLETAMGARLVVAAAGGWELTQEGRRVVESAEAIESAILHAMPASAADASTPVGGLVRVVSTEVFGLLVAAPALSALRLAHPRIAFELETTTRAAPTYGPAADLEIGVSRPASRRVETRKLADYRLGLFASRAYLAKQSAPETLDDLANRDHVYYVDSMLQVAELDFADRLFTRDAQILGATSVMAQVEITRRGVGIGILPIYLASRYHDLIQLMPALQPAYLRLSYWLSARPDNLRRPEVRAAATAIEQEARRVLSTETRAQQHS